VPGAALRGVHLQLPGYGADGPTLEVFTYSALADGPPHAVNRPGFGHIAFAVPSVERARTEVLAVGGRPVGEIVTTTLPGGRRVTWCYVTDPEGNVIELQGIDGLTN
jgi:catechol 2,3-dioxygenase-like lactoylglutathione lyase family enzyme